MNTQVATAASTALGALRSLKAGIQNVQQTLVSKSATPFLRLGRDGLWIYGAENIQVEDGSLWAANPLQIEHGWVAWDRSKGADNSGGPVGEVMVPMNQALPPKDTLKDVGHDWDYQMAIPMLCLNGTDKGEEVLYKANSVGGIDALDGLIKAIGLQLDADETKPVPVIKLGSGSYQHKKYGKTYTPDLTIIDWVPLAEQMPEVADPAPKAEPEVVKPRTRSVPTTKPTEPPADTTEDEDDELAALQRQLEEKRAAKAAAATQQKADTVPVDPKAAARAKLLAELAAMDGDGAQGPEAAGDAGAPAATAPAAGAPQRRRRT